jgi:hypothetical protein
MTPLIPQLIVTAILALIVGLCTPAFVHWRDFDVALTHLTNKRSSENASVLKAETGTSNWIAAEGKLVVLWYRIRATQRSMGGGAAPDAPEKVMTSHHLFTGAA